MVQFQRSLSRCWRAAGAAACRPAPRSRRPWPRLQVETDQLAMKVPLPFNRLRDSDARMQPRETFIIGLFVQPSIQPRRGYLERVLMRDDVFDVEDQADPLAHRRAIVERHAARLIYVYPQDRGFSPRHFGMNKFHAFARYNTLYDLAYTR